MLDAKTLKRCFFALCYYKICSWFILKSCSFFNVVVWRKTRIETTDKYESLNWSAFLSSSANNTNKFNCKRITWTTVIWVHKNSRQLLHFVFIHLNLKSSLDKKNLLLTLICKANYDIDFQLIFFLRRIMHFTILGFQGINCIDTIFSWLNILLKITILLFFF